MNLIKNKIWAILASLSILVATADANDDRTRQQAEQFLAEAHYLLEIAPSLMVGSPSREKTLAKYKRQAKRGDTNAQHVLGLVYFGDEIIRDNQFAYMWLRSSAQGGNIKSKVALENLKILMPPESIVSANTLSQNCQQNNYKNC